jgi:hypothetical protein
MKINIIIFALLPILFACDSSKKEQETLNAEVLAVHDEVMPKIGELEKVARKLNNLADSLSVDSTQATLIRMLQIQSAEVKNANESMMVWMRQYDSEYASKVESHKEVMKYFNDQLVKVTKVKEDMNGALEAGRDLLLNSKHN